MAQATNGELLKKINDEVIRIGTQLPVIIAGLSETKKILEKMNGRCDTTCEKNEGRFGRLFTQVRFQWWLISGLFAIVLSTAVAVIKLAFF